MNIPRTNTNVKRATEVSLFFNTVFEPGNPQQPQTILHFFLLKSSGNGQSCGKQPAPRWCKNGYCCDTKINKCVPVSDVGTNNVIPVITRRKLHFLSAADEMFPM